MTNTQMMLGGLALLVLLSRRPPSRVISEQQYINDYLHDPTNWGSDMWARLYGDDLAVTGGQHNAQSSLSIYGATNNAMGFIGSAAR